jgi:hypothetical protein
VSVGSSGSIEIRKECAMDDFTPEEAGPRRGEAVVFWSWIAVLAVGLAYMITVPLMGQ